jgi:hypothetical protein
MPLTLHTLQARLTGLHSASISMQYCITLELELRAQEIVFVNIGQPWQSVLTPHKALEDL